MRLAAIAGAAAALLLLLAAMLLAAPKLGQAEQHRLASQVLRWMPAAWDLGLRRPLSGERLRNVGALPFGGGQAVQLFHRLEIGPDAALPDRLWLPAVAGEVELYVNGAPIFDAPDVSAHYLAVPASRSMLVPIAPEYFHRGANRLDLVISDSRARALSGPVYLGPRERLDPAAERTASFLRSVRLAFLPLAALAAAASLAALLAARRSMPWLAAAAAASALGVRAWLAQPEYVAALDLYWPAADRLLLVATLLALAALLPWLREAWRSSRSYPRSAGLAALAALGAATAGLAIWGGLEQPLASGSLRLEAGYALGTLALMAVAAAGGGLVAGLAAVRFLRDRVDLSRLVRRQREEIDSKTLALQQEMRRGAILEERQRLARDMHDGIGGHLVSLIARVRSRRVDIDQVESELVDGLSELRLVVDSLDAAGDSLAEALAIFRMRAQPQVEACGMEFVWNQPDGLDIETDNPRWTLNVYRFLQEAVSNAVRHSQATRLTIGLGLTGAKELAVEIVDDGIGLPPAVVHGEGAGKGLANMRHRAEQFGGLVELGFAEGDRGTRIRLRLPIPLVSTAEPRPGQSIGEIRPS